MQRLPGLHSVATFGNGLHFFANRPEVHQVFELEGLTYGASRSGGIGLAGTLSGLLGAPQLFRRNRVALATILELVQPQLVLSDSYYGSWPRGRGMRAAVNNSDRITGHFFRMRGKPLSIFPHFFLVELLDCLWHRLRPSHRISPWFYPSLLCRREIQVRSPREPSRVLVMLSGSGLGPPLEPLEWELATPIDVVGRSGESQGQVRFHGKLADNTELLNQADVLVVHAGFSAISEAMAMRKPFVAVPLPGHAEQWVNARFVEQLGVGRMARCLDDLKNHVKAMLVRPQEYRRAYQRLALRNDAAEIIAASLLERIRATC